MPIFFYHTLSASMLSGRGLAWLGRKPPKLPTRDEHEFAGLQIPAAAPSLLFKELSILAENCTYFLGE